jgi:hypothetical protein
MAALEIILCHLGMTIGAIHLAGCFTGTMLLWINVGVAFHARDVPVLGILQVFFSDGQRDLLTIDRLGNILCFMAFQAFPIGHAEDQAGSAYGVRPMAVRASRDSSRFCFPKFPSYDFSVYLFDPRMTICTGSCDIASRDCGAGIGMGKNEVVSVAIIACCCDDETLPEETFTVYTLGIVAQDIPLGYVIYPCYRCTFPVAFPAQNRNIHFVRARPDV